ncbi:MAG: inositol monophosphatase family protein [Patescibacteria group bacterium]
MLSQHLAEQIDQALIASALEAATLIFDSSQDDNEYLTKVNELTGEKSKVTQVDRAAQQVIYCSLLRFFPNAGFIAEEDDLCIESTHPMGLVFTIDPIDGTSEYIRKGNEVSIMLSCCIPSQVLASVIYNPFNLEFYQLKATDRKVYRFRNKKSIVLEFKPNPDKMSIFGFDDPRDIRISALSSISGHPDSFFKDHWVLPGSYGTNIMKLANNSITGALLSHNLIQPWDEAPALGILKNLGFKYYVFNHSQRRFVEYEMVFSPTGYFRDLTLILHPIVFKEFIKTFEI